MEQGVEGRAVETLADKVASGHDNERSPGCIEDEALVGGRAGTCPHSPFEDHRRQALFGEPRREVVDMRGSFREHQAKAPAVVSFENVGDDLVVPRNVVGKRTMDAGDRAWDGHVELLLYAVTGFGEPPAPSAAGLCSRPRALSGSACSRACRTGPSLVVVDECHHVPAAAFESAGRTIPARYGWD